MWAWFRITSLNGGSGGKYTFYMVWNILTVMHSMISLRWLMIVSHSTIMSGDCRMLLWLFPVTIRSNSVSGWLMANFKLSLTSWLEKRNMNWTDSMTERAWTMGNMIRNRVDYWLKLKVRFGVFWPIKSINCSNTNMLPKRLLMAGYRKICFQSGPWRTHDVINMKNQTLW